MFKHTGIIIMDILMSLDSLSWIGLYIILIASAGSLFGFLKPGGNAYFYGMGIGIALFAIPQFILKYGFLV